MSGTHGLLQPNCPGYFYVTLEESYVTLFKISAEIWFKEHKSEKDADKQRNARIAHAVAKAYITDVLVNLSNELYKETKSEQNLWVFLSFPQLESRLHGGVKIRTLKDAMKEMIDDGYVFKRPNRDPRYKALEYRLNLSKFRKELTSLPTKPDKNTSANLHDEIDDAKLPDDSANLHHDSANLHDVSANLHDENANLHPKRNKDVTDKHNKDERKKERPIVVQEPQTSPVPNVSLSPLSQKNKEEETKTLEVDYPLFDDLCRKKGYAADFKIPRNDKNNCAIQDLRNQGATVEQVEFVFNDIWDDKDPFWKQHRGKLSTVASQFTARVWKMTAPAQKRQTWTGTPNWTEDRMGKSAQDAKPKEVVQAVPVVSKPMYGPKLDQTPTYTRLKLDKPSGPRSREARLQQERER